MSRLSDDELLEELKTRFLENSKALEELRTLTRKLKEVNLKLQESESMKSNFLSNIRNEINNPLTSILGLSRQCMSGEAVVAGDDESMCSVGSMLFGEAFELDFQLRNIFTAAELESGESVVSGSIIDIQRFMQNLVDTFSHKAAARNTAIKLSVSGLEASGTFKTDPEKLNLIVANLLNNAIEYGGQDGEVILSVWVEEDCLNVSVRDRGEGIDSEDQGVIFDRFRQLDSGPKKHHRGHGLGLSIVKDLVELLMANISITSDRDVGSLFTVGEIPEAESGPEADIFAVNGGVFLFEEDQSPELRA